MANPEQLMHTEEHEANEKESSRQAQYFSVFARLNIFVACPCVDFVILVILHTVWMTDNFLGHGNNHHCGFFSVIPSHYETSLSVKVPHVSSILHFWQLFKLLLFIQILASRWLLGLFLLFCILFMHKVAFNAL